VTPQLIQFGRLPITSDITLNEIEPIYRNKELISLKIFQKEVIVRNAFDAQMSQPSVEAYAIIDMNDKIIFPEFPI
jgi:hypothetical protein